MEWGQKNNNNNNKLFAFAYGNLSGKMQAFSEISGIITMFYVVRALSPYTDYEFYVIAVNNIGRGPPSIPATTTTGETGKNSFHFILPFWHFIIKNFSWASNRVLIFPFFNWFIYLFYFRVTFSPISFQFLLYYRSTRKETHKWMENRAEMFPSFCFAILLFVIKHCWAEMEFIFTKWK